MTTLVNDCAYEITECIDERLQGPVLLSMRRVPKSLVRRGAGCSCLVRLSCSLLVQDGDTMYPVPHGDVHGGTVRLHVSQELSEPVLTCPGEPGSTNFNCACGGSPRLRFFWVQIASRERWSGVVDWEETVHVLSLSLWGLVVSVVTVLCKGLATVYAY